MSNKLTKEDIKELNSRASKFFEKIAELVFAGVILSGILKEDIGLLWLILGGAISVSILLLASYKTFRNSKIK